MNFDELVAAYWNKIRRSGQPWTIPAITEDSGVPVDHIQVMWAWIEKQGSLSDADLIAKFNAECDPVDTPFGFVLKHKDGTAVPGTLQALMIDLAALLKKYGG